MTQREAPSQQDTRSACDRRRAGWLLALGATVGVVSGLFAANDGARGTAVLPPGVVALVEGRPISSEEYARSLAMLAGDRREPLSQSDRARVLERLIDEDLLVESALARGFLASDRSVRDAVSLAMVESIVAESASRAATQAELRASFDALRSAPGNPSPTQPFEAVRENLEVVVAARARNAALRGYLNELRERARIGCTEAAAP